MKKADALTFLASGAAVMLGSSVAIAQAIFELADALEVAEKKIERKG